MAALRFVDPVTKRAAVEKFLAVGIIVAKKSRSKYEG